MDFTKIHKIKEKLDNCDVSGFRNAEESFVRFVESIEVENFRRLKNLTLEFRHPITAICGQNRIGKTSILLLLACSHEDFLRLDSSKPEPTWRHHNWKDVLAFTNYETERNDYIYRLKWRVGVKRHEGEGKRLATSKAWSGLGKRAADRINAKIRGREVRLIDLERILPARSFSASLLRKVAQGEVVDLSDDISRAFCYVLEAPFDEHFKISEVAGHVNKRCYLISDKAHAYSSFNAASGEESLINLLRDVIEAPRESLILIDELEAGLHPSVQRRVADVLSMVAWLHKKQFVITTHSATLIDAFPPVSRQFIEMGEAGFRVIRQIAPETAMSKMDSIGHPLVHLYCEDDLAQFLVKKVLLEITRIHPYFDRLFDVVLSGGAGHIKTDFLRHKNKFSQVKNRHGFGAVFDGDMFGKQEFKGIVQDENVHFMWPREAPEVALVKAYLAENKSAALQSALENANPHELFQRMVDLGFAADKHDARSVCYASFERSVEYSDFFQGLRDYVLGLAARFSDPDYRPE